MENRGGGEERGQAVREAYLATWETFKCSKFAWFCLDDFSGFVFVWAPATDIVIEIWFLVALKESRRMVCSQLISAVAVIFFVSFFGKESNTFCETSMTEYIRHSLSKMEYTF